MYAYMHDPQNEVGHTCAICGCEMVGDKDICQRCADRMTEDDVYYED